MKNLIFIASLLIIFSSCERPEKVQDDRFTVDVICKTTPVKDQGLSQSCWAYAMLSMIESEHLAMGDSVNLSPIYIERMRIEEDFGRLYFSAGHRRVISRGTGMTLIRMLNRYGIYPFDSYHSYDTIDENAAINRLRRLVSLHLPYANAVRRMKGILDMAYGPIPRNVYMLRAEYTPLEFAHSVCKQNEYTALTSFTHHPFNQSFDLEIPDNWQHDKFMNVPIGQLEKYVVKALKSGHTAVWEGDISDKGFSFEDGVAALRPERTVSQEDRQRAFESYDTTDDHAMHIVGLAHDRRGVKYFIIKNSWGRDNAYKGYLFMSENYFRLKAVAVFLPTIVLSKSNL